MTFEGLEPVRDVSVGDWIEPRLCGFGGRVCSVVPQGFAAYARVLHPAADESGRPVSWAEVSRRTGTIPHPLMQWRSITRQTQHEVATGRWPDRGVEVQTTSAWRGGEPREGQVPPELLTRLLDLLADFTGAHDDCLHAVWEGWGWEASSTGVAYLSAPRRRWRRPPPVPQIPAGLPAEVLAGPRLHHPGRGYFLFRGPLHAALRVGHDFGGGFHPQSPSMLWPTDRSWLLATEVDFDSTLIGGPAELIDAVLHAPGVEAWPVAATDDLTVDGDLLNG